MSHIFLIAVEDSGDALGADVIDALRARDPNVRISGIGGARMKARGAASEIDLSGLAVLGLIEGLKAFGRVKKAVEAAAEVVAKADPDAVVLIDSWGFMWRLAKALKQRGVKAKRIKLIGPQVWATRPGRARVLAQWCDHLLCIHAFEEPFYTRWGLATTVIGNPALHRMKQGDGQAFRQRHGLGDRKRIIGLLPGSRRAEMRRVAPTLVEATEQICSGHPDRHVVVVAAGSAEATVRDMAKSWRFPYTLVTGEEEKANAFAAMEVAIACSGTVTTELGAQGAAVVTGYKLGWITWALLRLFLLRSRYVTLMNVAANEEVAPEFVQTRFSAGHFAKVAERLLSEPGALATQLRKQREALAVMAGSGRPAAEVAAETILKLA
ncbi:MAG TPA: lipid-A-disaccharide synthase [Hyphomonadaceae bacterium]|nr:lipid-A-disaccharide synthase [Hyphomonadaceae bacterium]